MAEEASHVTDPADLGVVEASALLRQRAISARELATACLARIRERDGTHSHEGDPGSINAWVRVYEDDALAAADRADERLARGRRVAALRRADRIEGPLCGRGQAADRVELACSTTTRSGRATHGRGSTRRGWCCSATSTRTSSRPDGTTDQVGNPRALDRSAGGSSGGSAAALAARMTPAATGTDTAGSLRIPSAACGTSTVKPTRGLVSIRGIVPLAPTLDHAGPMARSVADCEPLLAAMAGVAPPPERRALRRVAVSPRVGELDPDVADGFDAALGLLDVVRRPPPDVELDLGLAFLDLVCTEMLVWHRRFDDRRGEYRPSIRGFLEYGENRRLTGGGVRRAQERRTEDAARWLDWFAEHEIDALVEPTRADRGAASRPGYDEAFTDVAEISLTHYWNWTGFPVVALPSASAAAAACRRASR